jgi:excisionase family DNA binding protein
MDTQTRPIDGGSPLLTDEEACQYLRIRQRQLYSWRMSGIIPFIRIGRSIRYRLSDLEAVVEAMRVASPTGGGTAPTGNHASETVRRMCQATGNEKSGSGTGNTPAPERSIHP